MARTVTASTDIRGFRLSSVQRRLWTLGADSPAYRAQCVIAIEGTLDPRCLTDSLCRLHELHDGLRIAYRKVPALRTPLQVVESDVAMAPRRVMLAPGQRTEAIVAEIAKAERRAAFALDTPPLMRATHVCTPGELEFLVLTVPALAADAASLRVIVEDLHALCEQRTPSRLRQSYASALQASAARVDRDGSEAARYWAEQLAAGIEPLRRFGGPIGVLGHEFELEDVSWELDPELHATLARLAARCGARLDDAITAVWSALAVRLTQASVLTMARQVDVASDQDGGTVVGSFARAVVHRRTIETAPWLTLIANEADVRRQAARDAEAFAWPDGARGDTPSFVPLSLASDECPPPFVGQRTSFTVRALHACPDRFVLQLAVLHGLETCRLTLRADRRCVPAETVAYVQRCLQTLLVESTRTPEDVHDAAPALAQIDRHRTLVAWNDTSTTDRGNVPLHRRVEAWAAQAGDRVALRVGDEVLTYAELNALANRIARELLSGGVGLESRVALVLEPSSWVLASMLAAMKIGAAYVPLDALAPAERIASLIARVRAAAVITSDAHAPSLGFDGPTIIRVDHDRSRIFGHDDDDVVGVKADDPRQLAYVMCTSGSTGAPKAVVVTRAALTNYTRFLCERLLGGGMTHGPRAFACVSTPAADLGYTAIMPALASGGTLHWAADVARDADAFAAYMTRHAIDVLKIVPSHLSGLLAAVDDARVLPSECLILGGEPLPSALVERIQRLDPSLRVINHYGPTETTVGSLVHRVPPPPNSTDASDDDVVPIGRPIANTDVYVLDRRGHPAPIETRGELFIGGLGLARGYDGDPAATAERFVPHPFSLVPGARLYRTGDAARYRPDGAIAFAGRFDRQVKIRGFRVEPGEVEAVLRGVPGVAGAAVAVRGTPARLVAWVVPAGDRGSDLLDAITRVLAARLPDYMRPAAIATLATLPLTANGKIDYHTLPDPDGHAPAAGQEPRTATERVLVDIWRRVLRQPTVGLHDDFFTVGGDSILSLQVISQAARAGLSITPKDLFEHPTPAALATVAGRGNPIAAESGRVTGDVPLAPVQIAFFEQQRQTHHYNQAVLLQPRTRALLPATGRAVETLVDHHDALRSRFVGTDEGWRQIVDAAIPAPFTVVDLTALQAADVERCRERAADDAQTGFRVETPPLVRALWFAAPAAAGDRLLIIAHHLIVDGVSWRILLQDLASLCGHAGETSTLSLPAKRTSFRQWTHWLRARASTIDQHERAYWLEQARVGQEVSGLSGRGRTTFVTGGVSRRTRLEPDETSALLQAAAADGVAVETYVIAALCLALTPQDGDRRVPLEMEWHGRAVDAGVDLSRTVGWFTTHYPLTFDLTGARDGASVLRAVEAARRAVPGEGVGYGSLRYLARDRVLSAAQPPGVRFNFLGRIDAALDELEPFHVAPEPFGWTRGPCTSATHWLRVDALIAQGWLRTDFTADESVPGAAALDALVARFSDALKELVSRARVSSGDTREATHHAFPLAPVGARALGDLIGRLERKAGTDRA